MKINSTYTPKLSMPNTLKAISLINEMMVDEYKKNIEMIKIELPAFFREDSDLPLPIDNFTRKIFFDFGDKYDIAVLPLHYANWRRLMLNKLEAKPGLAIQTEGYVIWRDETISNVNSLVRDELCFTFVLENINKEEFLKKATKRFVNIIEKIAIKLKKIFDIENIIPKYLPTIETQLLENEMPKLSPEQKEQEILSEYSGFILNKPGVRTLRGKVQRPKPPQIYDLNKQNTIIINDRVNYLPLHVADISFYASGITLSDQMNMFSLKEHMNSSFYKELIESPQPQIIEIKIHKSQLYMALLGKGHIGEVQANVESLKVRKNAAKDKINFI
ncbi:hypothetical protein MYMA111404_00600 [Mycoplasma marinum]|uniref:hypothetical protein n=1 Tax=Mycoplasma marinum TaxID=1937190 RepID=UPI003B329CDE